MTVHVRPRRIAAVLLATALSLPMALLGAAPASAQSQPLYGLCDYPISHEFPRVNGNHGHELPPPAPYDGFDTGQVTVVITNLTNGKSATVNANSAAFYVDEHEGYFRGTSVAFFDSRRGEIPKGVWVVGGNSHVFFDDSGHVVAVTDAIIRRDLCAELA